MSDAVATPNIFQRLNAVMKDVKYVQKDRNAGSYKVVTHDAVTAKVRPALVEHGVWYGPVKCVRSQSGNRTEMDLVTRFVNVDEPSDFVDVETCGYGVDSQDKGPGKAMSYCVKMALLKCLGLETGVDADDTAGPEAEHDPDMKPETPHEELKKDLGSDFLKLDPSIQIDSIHQLRDEMIEKEWTTRSKWDTWLRKEYNTSVLSNLEPEQRLEVYNSAGKKYDFHADKGKSNG